MNVHEFLRYIYVWHNMKTNRHAVSYFLSWKIFHPRRSLKLFLFMPTMSIIDKSILSTNVYHFCDTFNSCVIKVGDNTEWWWRLKTILTYLWVAISKTARNKNRYSYFLMYIVPIYVYYFILYLFDVYCHCLYQEHLPIAFHVLFIHSFYF